MNALGWSRSAILTGARMLGVRTWGKHFLMDSFDFYRWKKEHVLRKNWQVHAKKTCPRDGTRLSFYRQLGKKERRAFWCATCQRFYGEGEPPELPALPPPARRFGRR